MKNTLLFYSKLSRIIAGFAVILFICFFFYPLMFGQIAGSLLIALHIFNYYNCIILLLVGIFLLFKSETIKAGIFNIIVTIIFYAASSFLVFRLFEGAHI